MWLTHAARPMRLDELAEAVAMETDTKSVEELETSMVNDYETLVTVCANLVVADTPVRPRGLSRCGVRFVHYSVQEYLLEASTDISSPENHSAVAKLKVEAQLAHAEMARLCITYLMTCGKLDGDETKFSTLFHYADSSWMHHIRFLKEIHKDLLELSLSSFEHGAGFYTIQSMHYFGRGGRRYDWRIFRCKHEPQTKFSPSDATLIFDLPNLQVCLSKEKVDQSQTPEGSYALHYAAKNNSCKAIELLLDSGFDVNVLDSQGSTPLHHASGKEAAQLLLDRGADVNIQDMKGRAALSYAAFSGHKQVVHLLLDRGAAVNAQDKEGKSALWAVAYSGFEGVAQLLLDRGADLGAQMWDGKRPLHTATASGHKEVTELFLERGADVNAQDNKCCKALWGAIICGHKEIV